MKTRRSGLRNCLPLHLRALAIVMIQLMKSPRTFFESILLAMIAVLLTFVGVRDEVSAAKNFPGSVPVEAVDAVSSARSASDVLTSTETSKSDQVRAAIAWAQSEIAKQPETQKSFGYKIQRGDSLSLISVRFCNSADDILRIHGVPDCRE